MIETVATSADIWPILWPVIIGGLLTLLPTVVGQFVSHFLSRSATRISIRRDRFQLLASQLTAYDDWLERRRNAYAFGEAPVTDTSPLSAATAIAMMDFPELLPLLDELEATARAYTLWQQHAGMRRLKKEIDKINDGMDVAYAPYWKKFQEVQAKLREVAASLDK